MAFASATGGSVVPNAVSASAATGPEDGGSLFGSGRSDEGGDVGIVGDDEVAGGGEEAESDGCTDNDEVDGGGGANNEEVNAEEAAAPIGSVVPAAAHDFP